MKIDSTKAKQWAVRAVVGFFLLGGLAIAPHWWTQHAATDPSGVTRIRVTDEVALAGVKRLGINLGSQTYFDGQQMMRNLIFRNPGFEAEGYRTIFHCAAGSVASCFDRRGGIEFPAGFWDGARYEVIDGAATGRQGVIATAGKQAGGYALSLDAQGQPIGAGDWLVASREGLGDPADGWWPLLDGGARLLAERADLSPQTQGKQALRIEAMGPGQSAKVASYFDTLEGHSFLHLRGHYRITFKAKSLGGARMVHLRLARLVPGHLPNLELDVRIGPEWAEYHQEFTANEPPSLTASIELSFTLAGGSMLLDDVDCEQIVEPLGNGSSAKISIASPPTENRTAFRDEVLETLRDLRPGVLRLMATSTGLGNRMEDLLVPAFARQRGGYSTWHQNQEDIPIGFPDLLELCQTVGAEPWIVAPTATSEAEARLLAEFLTGPVTTPGGAIRAASGHPVPWTASFKTIHVELGNETWNAIFAGQTIDDPAAYGRRANRIFSLIRAAAGTEGKKLDLIVGAQSVWPEREAALLAAAPAADTLTIAPYLMFNVSHWGTDDELFGPLLAESEQWARQGQTRAARVAAGSRGLAIYEVNLHTTEGTIPQEALDRFTPSLAAGIAVSGHMLRMLRDLGARDQVLYNLAQYQFKRADQKTVKLWGAVIETGANGRRRPQFLAEALANRAIAGDLMRVEWSGDNPTRDQPELNNGLHLKDAHELDAYAFRDGHRHTLILFNYGLHQPRRIQLDPPGMSGAKLWRLSAADPGANNETSVQVKVVEESLAGHELTLPPCSMTVLEWQQ